MNKYLPSKKFTVILFTLIIIFAIIYFFAFYGKNREILVTNIPPENTNLIIDNNAQASTTYTTLDSDRDGLYDWEETLWKTDPKNPDTDNDGTMDGEEVKLDRDPTKPNTTPKGQVPNDQRGPNTAQNNTLVNTGKLTTTEKVGQEILLQYLKTKKTNPDLTNTDINNIVNKALSYIPEISFKTYSNKDINIIADDSAQSHLNYSNDVAKIIIDNLKTPTEKIDIILLDVEKLTDNTKFVEQVNEIFQRFDPLIAKNKKSITDLLNIKVPPAFISEHLELLNSFQEVYESLNIMRNSANDGITFLLLKNHYDQSTKNLADALLGLTKKVYNLNVNYSNTNDYGYLLFDVIMLKN